MNRSIRLDHFCVAGVGAGACLLLGRRLSGNVGTTERHAVRRANRDGLTHSWWWPVQQLGTPQTLPLLSLLAMTKGRGRLAAAAALALPVEKSCEVGIKSLVQRGRPVQTVPGLELLDDAPSAGSSYPSGHSAIAACWATLVWPDLGTTYRFLVPLGVAGSGYARVHQGAHYPGDVLGGVLLGIAVGAGLRGLIPD